MALMAMMDNLIQALEKDEFVVGVFLDFSKAFDTVNHDIVLEKLHHYGTCLSVVQMLFARKKTAWCI